MGVNIGDKFGFGDIKSLGEAITRLITPMFSVATVLVVVYFLYGAFKYLISRGDKEQIEEARQTIIQAIVGFVILMAAFLILQFLLSTLFETTGLEIIKT